MSLSTAPRLAPSESNSTDSRLLGELLVLPEERFTFPSGLFGFPDYRDFALVAAERQGFYWLQSLESPSLTFLLADPFASCEGFSVELGETDLVPLRAHRASDIGVLAIVTLPRSPGEPATANLQGLIALNFEEGMGRQVIVQDSSYGVRWPLDLNRMRLVS
jgi:flagellar assembly factor FliW